MSAGTQTDQRTTSALKRMDHAFETQALQPHQARSTFDGLSRDPDFKDQDYALEQSAIMRANQGLFGSAEQKFRKLIEKYKDNPDARVAWARNVANLAYVISRRPDDNVELEAKIVSDLEPAEEILRLNGQYDEVGKIALVKSWISGTEFDHEQATAQNKRGNRLIRVYGRRHAPIETQSLAGMDPAQSTGSRN